MATELATGFISLTVKYKDAMSQINKDFAGVARNTQTVGNKAGGAFSTGFLSSTKGLSSKVSQSLQGSAPKQFKDAGSSAGAAFMGAFAGFLKGGAAGTAVAGVAGIGAIVNSGFGRLKSIDAAEAKLKGLGHSAEDVQSIMDSAMASVKGTAFGLGDAANAAATAVAAGVKPGKDLEGYLKRIGDTAAIAGGGLGEIAPIFNKVQTNGRAMTDDLQMLADRGIPVFTWLSEEIGVSGAELQKLVEDGKVDAQTFNKVIEENIGGAALTMGDSFQGSLENLKASFSRLGAGLLQPLFDRLPALFEKLTPMIDDATAAVTAHQDEIWQFFIDMGHFALDAADAVLYAFGLMLEAIGRTVAGLGDVKGALLRLNAATQRLVGNTELADDLDRQADAAFGMGESLVDAGQKMQDFNPDKLHDGLDGVSGALDGATGKADLFGDSINRLPDEKNVKIGVDAATDVTAHDLFPSAIGPDGVLRITIPSGANITTAPNAPAIGPGAGGHARGGVINGPGGTDNVLSWLTAGEGVVTKAAMGRGGAAVVAALNARGGIPGFAEGLNPGADYLRSQIMKMWPQIKTIGGKRADPLPEHPSGNAIDIMIPGWDTPQGKALGDAVAAFVSKNADALGLTHFIWQQRLFGPGDTAGDPMGDRGSPTQNHMDHVHVWLQKGGGKLPTAPLIGGGGTIGGGGGGVGGSVSAGADAVAGAVEDELGTGGGTQSDNPYLKIIEAVKEILPDFGAMADIGVGGLKETLLPPGFADPFESGLFKAASGLMGFMSGLTNDPVAKGILGIGSAVASGSGSGAVSAIEGLIPAPFGSMQPGAGMASFGALGAPPGSPVGGQLGGPMVDNSIHIAEGGTVGTDPNKVMDKAHRQQVAQQNVQLGTRRFI